MLIGASLVHTSDQRDHICANDRAAAANAVSRTIYAATARQRRSPHAKLNEEPHEKTRGVGSARLS